jgi:hypothetical protein
LIYPFLFIVDLCKNASNSSDYIASSNRMISEKLIGKDVDGRGCVLILALA